MKPDRKSRRRRKKLRRVCFSLVFIPIALWGIANLFFSISWGTDLLAGRLENKTGFPCRIESVTWTPWGGVRVRDVVVHPSLESGFTGELVRIDAIDVDLSWLSLIQRKKRFDRLEVVGVTGKLPLELLQSLLKREPAVAGTIAENPSLSTPPENKEVGDKITQKPETPPASQDPPQPVEKSPPAEPVVRPVDDFEGVVEFREVNLELYSDEFPGGSLAVEALQGTLPLWGRERGGAIGFSSLYLGREKVSEAVEVPLLWKEQYLRIDKYAMKFVGVNLTLDVALRLVAGLPFGLEVEVPEQSMDLSPIYGEQDSPLSIRKLAFKGVFQGYITVPRTYSGFGILAFNGLVISDQKDGSSTEFDRGFGEIHVGGAGAQLVDCRFIGDEEAVMFNGFVTNAGEAGAVIRLVGSPERVEVYESRVRRTNPQWALGFQPLMTRDRWFRDLHIVSGDSGLLIDIGENRELVPFLPAAKTLLSGKQAAPTILP